MKREYKQSGKVIKIFDIKNKMNLWGKSKQAHKEIIVLNEAEFHDGKA